MRSVFSIIIFSACVALFIWGKLPMATTAILGCTVMVLAGVCGFGTAFGQFSSSTVILTGGVMIIGAAISETGLAAAIGGWIVRVSGGSQIKLIAGTYLVSALMSAFLTNSAVLAVFMPIIFSLAKANPGLKAKNLIMPIAYGCIIGGASTLVGSTQQLTAQGLLERMGARTFKIFDFTLVGGILVILGLIYCLTIGLKRGEEIWGNREDDVDYEVKAGAESFDKRKMSVAALIFAGTVIIYITEYIPFAVTSTDAALLCIITGCISQEKAILAINWNILGRLAGCLGLAGALEAGGGVELISGAFRHLTGESVSPFPLFCLIILFTQVISEFITNSTALLITLPIVLSAAPDLGLNSYAFALGATIASGVALSCPLANSTLTMSMCAGYRFNDYFKYSIFFDIITYLVIILTVPAIYGLTV